MSGRLMKVELVNPGPKGKQLVLAWDESGEVHLLAESNNDTIRLDRVLQSPPIRETTLVPNNSPVVKAKKEDRKAARAAFPRPPSVSNGGLLVCNKGHDLTLPDARGRRKNGHFFCRACNRVNLDRWVDRRIEERKRELEQGDKVE